MEIDEGKRLIFAAFWELAWADGKLEQKEIDFIIDLAHQMDLPLGVWLPDSVGCLPEAPRGRVKELAKVPLDEVERYQVTERLLGLCLLGTDFSKERAMRLADLALQLGITADELEEMRRRLC